MILIHHGVKLFLVTFLPQFAKQLRPRAFSCVLGSMAEVASSSSSTAGWRSTMRARHTNCRCPKLRLLPDTSPQRDASLGNLFFRIFPSPSISSVLSRSLISLLGSVTTLTHKSRRMLSELEHGVYYSYTSAESLPSLHL